MAAAQRALVPAGQLSHAERYNRAKPIITGLKRGFMMDNQISVLGLLRKARDLVEAGQYAGVIEAISALKAEANGPKRDIAYYAVLETAHETKGETGMTILAAASRDMTVALLDATIKRITSKMH